MHRLTFLYSDFILGSCLLLEEEESKNSVRAYKKLKSVLNKVNQLEQVFLSSIVKSAPESISNENPCNRLLFCGLLMQHFHEKSSHEEDFKKLKSFVIDHYANNLIGSRVKPQVWLVKCSNYWLRFCTRDDFKDKLLPEIRRYLLRSPEIILQAIGLLFESLVIDLSDFGEDLQRSLGSQFLSKDEQLQHEASCVFKSLAKQCSSNECIQRMLKHLFFILNGGEAKLATATQKQNVLNGIGSLAHNSSHQLNPDVFLQLLQLFGDYLKTETHEATLIFTLKQLNVWFTQLKMSSFNAECVKKLNDFFKTLSDNKSYSFMLKSCVYHDMCTIYSLSGSSLIDNVGGFAAQSMQAIEKAVAQVTQNNAVNTEALGAALLLSVWLANDLSNGMN